MLQNIRDNARGFGAILMLGLLILAFAIWGIDFQFGANQPVVKVNGEEVSNALIANSYNQQIQRFQEFYPNGIPDVTQAELKQNVIDSFVRNELLNQHVAEEGYHISDTRVMQAIRELPAFQLEGKFNAAQFEFLARRNGLTSDGLFNDFRKSMVLEQLSEGFVSSSFVTSDEARMRGQLESESRTVREMRILASSLLADITVEDAAIEADFELNQEEFLTEEMVSLEYIELDPAVIAETVTVSEEDLRARYDAGVGTDEYSSPEQRNARHILVAVNDERDDATAKSEAQALRERIIAGEDFAELARELSDDAGSRPSGGELGWSSGEGYVAPFRDALFSMTEDQISEPIKTRFGYHIIRTEGIRGNEPKPYEEVRDQIEAELRENAALDRLSDLVNELDEIVYDIDDSLSSAAETAGVEVNKVPLFTRAGGTGIATFPAVRDAAFSQQVLVDKLNSDSIELEDKYVYIRLDEHRPSRMMTLDEVRPRIEARIRRERAAEQVAALGSDLVRQLNEGKPMEEVATSADLVLSEAKDISRLDRSLPPPAINALFATSLEGDGAAYGGVDLPNGDYFIYELQSIQPGDSLSATQVDDIARANANMELAAYIASLRELADVEVRADALQTR